LTWQRTQQLLLRAGLLGHQIDNQLTSRAWKRWREAT
jgi:Fe-S cluster biosynthesis and repair protein YggX